MNKVLATAALLFYLYLVQARTGQVEPRCSKYEFEEKVLEKVIRFEHKMELFNESMEKISAKVEEITNSFSQQIENMRSELKETKTEFDFLKQNMEEKGSMMNETIQSQLRNFRKSFDDPAAQLQHSSYAFSAHDLSTSRPSSGDILVFTKTHFNEDGLYSTTTGKYTAPADGIYVFHATLTGYVSNKGIHVEFKAGGIALGRFVVNDKNNYDWSNSGSATARLQRGTEVYLRVTSVSSGYRFQENTYYMNTFSGYRVNR